MKFSLRRPPLLGLGAAVILGLAACGPALSPEGEETATAAASMAETPADALPATPSQQPTRPAEPPADFDVYGDPGEDAFTTTDSGLQYHVTEAGEGEIPQAGEVVSVQYTGYLSDGTEFDSSLDQARPFSFVLGERQVISGWDEGIALLNEGGQARLVIPPDLGYGPAGNPPVIPADATLVFDVELVDIHPPAPEAPAEVAAGDYAETDNGVRYFDLVEGEGPAIEEGQEITLHYTGWLEDGTRFDSSLLQGRPAAITFGSGQPILGWDEGITGMNVGGLRQIVVPPELAFGEAGAGNGVIPPDATLIFEIEVLEAS
ncbi:MAG: FKBP-type peptidyl-prolyl cis-trans isomerase [Candidatus Promineifilaceae bacterium]